MFAKKTNIPHGHDGGGICFFLSEKFAEFSIGKSNPDWALLLKNEKRIYFVAETKSTLDADKRRKEENQKIRKSNAANAISMYLKK